jgi:hypothetical protein
LEPAPFGDVELSAIVIAVCAPLNDLSTLPKINRSTRRESRHVRSGGEVGSKREGAVKWLLDPISSGDGKGRQDSDHPGDHYCSDCTSHLDVRAETATRIIIDSTAPDDIQHRQRTQYSHSNTLRFCPLIRSDLRTHNYIKVNPAQWTAHLLLVNYNA